MVIFYKKWYNLSMLHSMTIRLIYVHLLEPFNLCQMPPRGIWGQILIFMLIAISPLCYINIPAGFVSFQRHNGSSYPAGAAAGSYIASVSSSSSSFFFFLLLLLSVNIAISPTAYMVWPCDSGIFISLMTATKLMGLEIHLRSFGVTGVKKVNHVKNMKTALI